MNLMIQKRTKPVAFYHWWSHPDEPDPFANLRTPILLSIATLRSVSDMPIIVLDLSERSNNWSHFPEKLNFQIHRIKASLKGYHDLIAGWQFLSRIHDLKEWHQRLHPERPTVMYVDSDVFWFKDPEPLACDTDGFCFDGYNTGLFYYSPQSHSNQLFHDRFETYVKAAIFSPSIRQSFVECIGYDSWYGVWDEMILSFMLTQHKDLFRIIPREEHLAARNDLPKDTSRIKMLHCNGMMVSDPLGETNHCRGLTCLVVKEFYDNIRKVFNQSDLDLIFTKQQQEFGERYRVSLFENWGNLQKTKDSQGHFHLMNSLSHSG